jgi:hypothetical protein
MTESEIALFIVATTTQTMFLTLTGPDLHLQEAPGKSNAEAPTSNNKFEL